MHSVVLQLEFPNFTKIRRPIHVENAFAPNTMLYKLHSPF